jgi:hypothetical protein
VKRAGRWLTGLLPLLLAAASQAAPAQVEVFTREGCSRCEAALGFLRQLARERPELTVTTHDVARDPAARERLLACARAAGVTPLGVPAFLVGDELIVGFAGPETTGARLRAALDRDRVAAAPLGGRLNVRDLGLPAFTLALGLLDGLNPCAMWVLLFLLSLLINLRSRARMLLIAGTFVLVSGLVYFAFMVAWLNVFLLLGVSRAIQLLLGGIAVAIGALNVKDFLALGRGPSLSIPARAKPGLYARMRRILQADDLPGALGGVVALAVLVNAIELMCTAGLPALYTRILTERQLPWWQYYAYVGLYNVAYVLDDGLMVLLAVATLGRHKLAEREGRWLKLVSGVVMLALGALLVARPDWLTW